MRLVQCTTEKDGFYGLFSPIADNRKAAVIVLEDGHPNNYIVKTAMKWLNRSGVSIYDHCGHLIFPESMMKLLLPNFLVDMIIPRLFSNSKGFTKECRRSRIDLDEHIQSTIKEWIDH